MKDAPGIDVVTRLYDLADLPLLDRLVFSVMGQAEAGPVRLHVMLQRFSFAETRAVREAVAGLRRLHGRASLTLHNWDFQAPFDLRVPLLNWGLEVAEGRYVIPLDIRDQLHPRALATLLAPLRGTPAALALGGVTLQPVWWWGDVVLSVPGLTGEPSPVPIFLIDTGRLAVGDRVFLHHDTDGETGEFVARIGRSYAVDATHQGEILAVRGCPLGALELSRQA